MLRVEWQQVLHDINYLASAGAAYARACRYMVRSWCSKEAPCCLLSLCFSHLLATCKRRVQQTCARSCGLSLQTLL